jgi:hypothetical protein
MLSQRLCKIVMSPLVSIIQSQQAKQDFLKTSKSYPYIPLLRLSAKNPLAKDPCKAAAIMKACYLKHEASVSIELCIL